MNGADGSTKCAVAAQKFFGEKKMGQRFLSLVNHKYSLIREKNELEALQRKAALYQALPELAEIDNKINGCGIGSARKILNGDCSPGQAVEQLKAEIEELKNQRGKLLSKNGYSPDYLGIRYSCSACRDTGFIGADRCACFERLQQAALFELSNVGNDNEENWENFSEELFPNETDEAKYGIKSNPRSNIIKIRERCTRFMASIDDPKERNLMFHGPAGTGKTFTAKSIAKVLMKRGISVLYKSAPALFEEISRHKVRMYKEGDFEDPDVDYIYDCELLIIDDLGTESATPAKSTELLNLLNTREANDKVRTCKTIISSNISPAKLFEYYNERIASRIIGSFDRLMFAGNDIRIMKALKST